MISCVWFIAEVDFEHDITSPQHHGETQNVFLCSDEAEFITQLSSAQLFPSSTRRRLLLCHNSSKTKSETIFSHILALEAKSAGKECLIS